MTSLPPLRDVGRVSESVGPHSRSGDGTSCAYCSREASTPTSHNAVTWPCAPVRKAREQHYAQRTPAEGPA